MKIRKLQVLTLTSLILLTNTIYAATSNNAGTSSKYVSKSSSHSSESNQTLTDTDGDGYFPFTISSKTTQGNFPLVNNGTAMVDVIVYSVDREPSIWSARVNLGGSAESSDLSLTPGKYYFKVVSDDGSSLNVLCSAKY